MQIHTKPPHQPQAHPQLQQLVDTVITHLTHLAQLLFKEQQ
jgi:hypothetical protein